MATPPVDNPTSVWATFCTDAERLLAHPMASPEGSLGRIFDDWGLGAVRAWAEDQFRDAWVEAWDRLAREGATEQAAFLLLRELQAFSSYVREIIPRLDLQARTRERERDFVMPQGQPGMKESLSILSTILDSLCDLFPQLKGLLKAGHEFVEIKRAFF